MRQIMNEKLEISASNPIRARHYDYDRFTYPWHFHSQYELIYVAESHGQCFVGDCIEQYSAGDIILLGSNVPHYMRSNDIYHSGETSLRVQGTIIQFEQNFLQYSLMYYPQLLLIKTLLEEAKRGILFPKKAIEGITKQVVDFPQLKGFRQISVLLEILQELANTSQRKSLASACYYEKLPSMGNKRMDKIISFINGNYTRNLKLDEVAEMANMNTTAFCRFFKEATGKTFLQYVMDMRTGYACKLLTIGDLDVAQVAIDSGFESISNFNRIFKQKNKMTPVQYRKQITTVY